VPAGVQTSLPGLDILTSGQRLSGAEVELVGVMAREARLKTAIAPLREQYDFILIDCPPSLGLLTVNALTAADSVLIPLQCEYLALEGLTQLIGAIRLVQDHLNPALRIEGVLLTMFDARLNLAQQVVDEARKFFSDRVYKTVIPRNVRLGEAPSFGKPIVLYDPHSVGAEKYRELAREVLEHA
jgi:chromosome partitioning protein